MINRFYFALFVAIIWSGCSSSSVKEKINKAGDVSGQAVSEFVDGVSKGVDKVFEVKIDLPQSLKEKGIRFGKITIGSDTTGHDNFLTVYMIFEKDFSGNITAKAFDNKGIEMGRVSTTIEAKTNEAKYIEFVFDKRTNIDHDSKITLE